MKKILISFLYLLLINGNLNAQEHIIIETYNKQEEITATGSITFKNGFSAAPGTTLRAYISPISPGAVKNAHIPHNSYNYVISYDVKSAGIVNPFDTANFNSNVNVSIGYVDGQGRPVGTVAIKSSPSANSMLQYQEYDDMGREAIRYLPYTKAGDNGNALPTTADALNFYTNAPGVVHTPYPFSETKFERTALNRVLEEGAPGDYWQLSTSTSDNKGHTKSYWYDPLRKEAKYESSINTITGERSLYRNGNNEMYPLNALERQSIRDENATLSGGELGAVMESKDSEGRVIMRRTFNKNGAATDTLSTYYIYDKFGNLSFVLPPGANPDAKAAITQQTLDNFCYQYLYDGRNRLIEKKIPGKGKEIIIYNKLDQIVFTQDAEQAKTSPSPYPYVSFIKYDALGRVIMTGVEKNYTGSRQSIQDVFDTWAQIVLWEKRDPAGWHGYTNVAVPYGQATMEPEVVNYYDDYNIPGIPNNQSASYTKMTRGLLTATKKKVLGSADHFLWTINYYDDDGRIVRVWQQHYKGGILANNNYDEIAISYNFSGQVLSSVKKHFVGAVESLYVRNDYVYDAQGRPADIYQTTGATSATIINKSVLLSRNEYNELAQLQRKRLHSTDAGLTFVRDVNYTYNERGWLKSQDASNLFNQTLKYQEAIAGVIPQYNGNISRQEWADGASYYNYTYDNLNRLTSAISNNGNNEVIGYDRTGNITRLQRKQNNVLIDQLKYTYMTGNRLASVQDTNTNALASYQLPGLTNYTYNDNGSMISRTNSSNVANNMSSMIYNRLSLPTNINVNGGLITYTYDADGNKLRKQVTGTTILNNDYISGIQYEGGVFAFAQTPAGRVIKNGSGSDPVFNYEYTLTDHLGNARVYFDIYNGAARKIQETDYYAFGLSVNGGGLLGAENKYQYNGKEKQDQEKMFDYGARFYDPVIGRWNVIDPLAEDYVDSSPYNYVLNNPINFTDPDGMWVDRNPVGYRSTVVDATGKIIDHRNDGDNSVYQLINGNRIKLGTEKEDLDYDKLIGQQLNPLIYDPNPIDLNELVVTAKKKPNSALEAMALGLTLRTGTKWSIVAADPEGITKTLAGIGVTLFSAYVIADEATEYYSEMKRAKEWEGLISGGAEHKKGKSKRTKGKHQKGQANKKKARGGEKGESLPPRKRPIGWTGSWPPK